MSPYRNVSLRKLMIWPMMTNVALGGGGEKKEKSKLMTWPMMTNVFFWGGEKKKKKVN